MAEVGRPTELTDELTTKIRALVLDSKSYTEVQQILEIPTGTWDHWVYTDYQGFRGKLTSWKRERMVKKAEAKVEALIEADDERVALQASTFALETLGKEEYSKRSELTGKDGENLQPVLVKFLDGKPIDNDRDTGGVQEAV
jgi:hypothetical protein